MRKATRRVQRRLMLDHASMFAMAGGMLIAMQPALAQTPPVPTPSQPNVATDGAPALSAQNARDEAGTQARTSVDAQPPAHGASDQTSDGDIIVTASRITRDGYQAPTPTTVVSSEAIAASAQPTVAAYINTLPALAGSNTPRNTGSGVGGGTGGANLLNLRSLGVSRTLTLLDGRRVVGAATSGAVDLNSLPLGLIKRVDVVTGGASAAWGSDAVAGVVNFVLDTGFTGLKGEVTSGISEHGDAQQFRTALSAGTSFAGGRGHLIVSGEYFNGKAVERAGSRDWFQGWKILPNPAFVAGNGQPQRVLAPAAGFSLATTGGLITAGPLRGTYFLPGGAPAAFDFGQIGGSLKLGGTPSDIAGSFQLLAPLEYGTAFARIGFDVTEAISVFAEGNYGKTESNYRSAPYLRFANITIQRDNAYLDATTRARMVAANVTNFTLGRDNLDLGEAAPRNVREMKRGVIGGSAKLGGSWNADVYYQHGESDVLNQVRNDAIVSRYNLATDAVAAPGGAIVCRSTLADPGNGCVPIDLFGANSFSPAAKSYIYGVAEQNVVLKQDVAAATVRGDLFALPAGTVSIAAGAEYRRESYRADADPISITSNFWVGNYKPSRGRYTVKEAFGEILVPVIKSEGFFRSLDVNAAARVTDYSTSGSVVTWKGGATAGLTDNLRLRVTRSRDIRAPNLNDLFLGGSVSSEQITDAAATYFVRRVQTGNRALVPERADTLSGGAILTPTFLPGFSVSVDYYRIRIGGAIATLTSQQIINGCAGGTTELCGYVTRNAGGQIAEVTATGLNLAQEKTSGVDIESSYRRRLSDMGIGSGEGAITLRGLATYVDERSIALPGLFIDYAGEVADYSLPHWRGLFSASYDNPAFAVTVTGRYVGAGKLSNTFIEGISINENDVRSRFYVDLNTAVRFRGNGVNGEFFFAVENLFDLDPSIAPGITAQPQTSFGTNSTLYDTIGRQFRAGFRFKL